MSKFITTDGRLTNGAANSLNQEINSQSKQVTDALEIFNETETRKKEINALETESTLLQNKSTSLSQNVNDSRTQQYLCESELQSLPKQIDIKEKELVIHIQKLKKLQKLDHLSHCMDDYLTYTDDVILIKEACINHNKEAFDQALLKLVNVNSQDHQEKTALIHAIQNNFPYAIDKLLQRTVDLHIKDQQGNSALHWAIILKNNPLIETLIKYDDKIITDKDSHDRSPLYLYLNLLLEHGDEKIIKLLLTEIIGGEALIYSATQNNLPVATKLLYLDKKLAHFNDIHSKSVLSLSLEQNRPEISKLLLSYGASLPEALDSNKFITHINFEKSRLSPDDIVTIGDELKNYQFITSVNFSATQLGKVGSNIIAEALKVNQSITQIDLSSNNMGYEGTNFIADALTVNKSIQIINLYNNNLHEAGAIFIATLFSVNFHITTVNLAGNNIGDTGAIFLANGLAGNNCIININLSSNNIGDKGAEALGDCLTINCSIVSFNISANNITNKGINYFVETLKKNQSLLSPIGLDNNEKYISGKILQNQQEFRGKLQKLETLEKLTSFNKDNPFRELFIIVKQIQSKFVDLEHELNPRGNEFYFGKIKEACNYFSSNDETLNDGAYKALLLGQLELLSDSEYFNL